MVKIKDTTEIIENMLYMLYKYIIYVLKNISVSFI